VATTAGILNAAGITVIGLTPGGAGNIADIDALAAATGGSVQSTTGSGDRIKEAILTGLKLLTTDVWYTVTSSPGLTVTLTPAVRYGVPGSTMVTFTETISVANDPALLRKTLYAKVTFLANKYPAGGHEIGVQDIVIFVPPPNPVPGVSFWGSLALALTIGGTMVVLVRRRSTVRINTQ
jgi:hypothetical protein